MGERVRGVHPGPRTVAAAIVAGESVLERSLGRSLGASPDARYLPLLIAAGFFGEGVLTREGFEAARVVAAKILRGHRCTLTSSMPPLIRLATTASAELEPLRSILAHPDVGHGTKCNVLEYLAQSLHHAFVGVSDKVWEVFERLARAKDVLRMHDSGRLEHVLADALPGYVQVLGARLERRGNLYTLVAGGAEEEASIDDIVVDVVRGVGVEAVASQMAEKLAEKLGYGVYGSALFRIHNGMVELLYPERKLVAPTEFIEAASWKPGVAEKLVSLGLKEPPLPRAISAGGVRIEVGEYGAFGFQVFGIVGGKRVLLGEALTTDELAEILVSTYVSKGVEGYLQVLERMGRGCLVAPARALRRLDEGGVVIGVIRVSGCTAEARTGHGDILVSRGGLLPLTGARGVEIEFAGGLRTALAKAPWPLLTSGVPARLVTRGGAGRFSPLLSAILAVLGTPASAGVDSGNNVLDYGDYMIIV